MGSNSKDPSSDGIDFNKRFKNLKASIIVFQLSTMMVVLVGIELSNYFSKLKLAQNIAEVVSNSFLLKDYRKVIDSVSASALNDFNFIEIEDLSTSKKIEIIKNAKSLFYKRINIPFYFSSNKDSIAGFIYFEYRLFTSWTTIIAVWLLLIGLSIYLFNNFRKKLEDEYHFKIKTREEKIFLELSKQVSHDIRSPLAALNMVVNDLAETSEKNRIIIRSSVNRINDIANQLLEKGKTKLAEDTNLSTEIKLSVELLSPLVDSLISLKRVQFREKQGVEIDADINQGYGLFAKINLTELHRVLSNTINNAIEAMPLSKGKVSVALKSDQNNILLIIKDNGKGIPLHILAKLGEMGVSHGKEGTQSGSGLGVYHAKKTIESFGGKFEITSIENQGTTITMTFPKAQAPKWFVEKLSISPQVEVISLDDDLSIHQIWKGRFESMNTSINHLTFTSGLEFKNFVNNNNKENKKRLYLIDFELLNQNQTGLDIIEELNIGEQSILVTSRYEEESIRSRCENLGVKLIPKTMAERSLFLVDI